MPQSKKTTSNKSKSAATVKKSQTTPRTRETSRPPLRREIIAGICFILALLSFIGYWNADGVFFGFFIGLIKGLIGYGYFALPPALLFCAVILTFHRGRPVRLRIVCITLMTILIGSFFHLFTAQEESLSGFAMFGELWRGGTQLYTGGIVSGSITALLNWLFGFWGTLVILICFAALLVLVSLNRTIADIVDAYRHRERREYIPEPDDEDDYHTYAAQPQQRHIPPGKHGFFSSMRKKKQIDIPVDGVAMSAIETQKAKDDYIKGATVDSSQPDSADERTSYEVATPPQEENKKVIDDLPLDIPFMESPRRKPISRMHGIVPEIDYEPRPERESISEPEPSEMINPYPPFPSEKERINDLEKKLRKSKKLEDIATDNRLINIDPDGSSGYAFPPLSLLSHGTPKSRAGDDEVKKTSERLEAAFESFGVNVTISKATRGPAVTRYEAELEAGIKLSRLTGLADDIALSLGTSGVRIAAMPNKIATVGIEVPNRSISTVSLRDIIESREFTEAKSKLTFAIGMDISGDAIVGDIAKLPHILIAGTTGSGKSVCLNSIILSILYKSSPDDVRFIMIDPKMVEFKVYNSIPHLLVPVVTDVKKAAGALQWAVFEMMKRYALFSDANARDLAGYNKIAQKSGGELEVKPQVVIIIDELADLMLTAGKEVEESVCRVAQMGRAAGMHLVIATQSPRADVITGLMKANIPSRISFKVSSALESRIILDAGGNADKLVGRGDMLYALIGGTKPIRVQGTWVTDKERESVVDFIKQEKESNYSDEVIHEIEKAAQGKSSGGGKAGSDESAGDDFDDLLPQAVDVIFETGQASVSMLQRRLKLGYARAARIVDQMEQMGVVGAFEGSKPRSILITKDQWRQMQYGSGVAPAD